MLSQEGWNKLEEMAPMLFLVGGLLVTVFAAMLGYEAFTGKTAPEDIFGPAGFALGFVGLLGLVPRIKEESKGVARAGAVIATLAAVGATATSLASVAQVAGVQPPEALRPLALGIFLGMLLGYSLFGIATLKFGTRSRTVGLLLLVPSATFIVMMTSGLSGFAGAWSNFALSSSQAIAHLAIGYTLKADAVPVRGGEPAAPPA